MEEKKKLSKTSKLILLTAGILILCLAIMIITICLKKGKNNLNTIINSDNTIENILQNKTDNSDVSYIVLEIEDIEAEEKNRQGIEYKNIKITDKEKINSLMEIIDSATPYKQKGFIPDFGDIPPVAKIYLSNGEKYTIIAGDQIDDSGDIVNLIAKWYGENDSNKTLYKVNTKLGEKIEKMFSEIENNTIGEDIEEKQEEINKKIITSDVPISDLTVAMVDTQMLFYGYIENGKLTYYMETGEHVNFNPVISEMKQYNGLNNIKRMKVFNPGTSVDPVIYVITEEGEVYLSRFSNYIRR